MDPPAASLVDEPFARSYAMSASRHSLGAAALVALTAGAASGCIGGLVQEHTAADRVPDEAALSTLLVERQYRGAGYVRLDRAGYDSAMVPGESIHIYASTDGAAAAVYAQLEPDQPSPSEIHFPVGGVVVREVVDASGDVTGLTLVAHMRTGWFPANGDLLYGVTDAGGTPAVSKEDSHLQWGHLAECGSCHGARARESYLFGVPPAVRATP
jgi:hypothetical protein